MSSTTKLIDRTILHMGRNRKRRSWKGMKNWEQELDHLSQEADKERQDLARLPDWHTCEMMVDKGNANPLERFINQHEPSGPAEDLFREQLAELVTYLTGFPCKPK